MYSPDPVRAKNISPYQFNLFHLLIHPERQKLKGLKKWLGFPTFLLLAPFLLLFNNITALFRPVKPQPPEIDGKILVLLDSLNNYNVLKFLQNHFEVTFCTRKPVPLPEKVKTLEFAQYQRPTTSFKAYFFILYIAFSRKYQASQFWEIFRNFNIIKDFQKAIFDKKKPRAVITSNDHTPFSRGMILLCHENQIPCFYLQHAATSHVFPPLLFTASFLYGEKSKEMYEKCGPLTGEVHLVGHHKFDECEQAIQSKKITKRVAICIKKWTLLDDISALVNKINDSFPDLEIIVRTHPRQKDVDPAQFGGKATINSAARQPSEDFLKDVDVVIGDNSSILLEGAIMNCYAIQTPLSEKYLNDYYGFISEGVVDFAENQDKVVEMIGNYYQNPISRRSAAAPFDASIGSPWEFHVEQKIISILHLSLSHTPQ